LVQHGNEPCGIEDINNIGFHGPDFSLGKDDDKCIIPVTGDSVAA
jgi:hypothetical protein